MDDAVGLGGAGAQALEIVEAAALRARGTPDLVVDLAAEAGVTVFKIGFETWIGGAEPVSFAQCIRDALVELKAMTAAT